MNTKKCLSKNLSPREKYYSGEITADEYLKEIEKSDEGDRKRRTIEKEFNRQSNHLSKMLV